MVFVLLIDTLQDHRYTSQQQHSDFCNIWQEYLRLTFSNYLEL